MMVSIRRVNATWQIRFSLGGRRCSMYVSVPDDQVAVWMKHVDHLVAAHGRTAPSAATTAWVASLAPDLREKLAGVGLVPAVPKAVAPKTLGQLCDEYLADRKSDVKRRTLVALQTVIDRLKEFFGADCPIDSISATRAREFRDWLSNTNRRSKKAKVLATATIRRRIGRCREIFAAAVREDSLRRNPFDGLPANVRPNPERAHYIDHTVFSAVLKAAPNPRWRSLLVLARFGGLRIPSEVAEMRWNDIAWEANRFTVRSPKTSHIEGKATRVVPLFPEIRKELTDLLLIAAEDGAEFVFPSIDSDSNLRTTLEKIITRAGQQQWPRLWQNLRVSAATDLARNLPGHVAAAICGHSEKIAMEHYWQVTSSDFDAALGIHQTIHMARQIEATRGKNTDADQPSK